jgi:hypothetical protein
MAGAVTAHPPSVTVPASGTDMVLLDGSLLVS